MYVYPLFIYTVYEVMEVVKYFLSINQMTLLAEVNHYRTVKPDRAAHAAISALKMHASSGSKGHLHAV